MWYPIYLFSFTYLDFKDFWIVLKLFSFTGILPDWIFGFQGFLDFSGHFFVHLTFDELGLKILFSSDLRCYIQGLLDIWIFGFNTYQIYDIPDCCHIFGFKDFWIIRKFFVHLTFDELGLRILGYVDFISFFVHLIFNELWLRILG